jgi:hypothetical protein
MPSDTVNIGPYTVGEKPPPLVYQFLDSAGAPINLTGYTAKFQYQRTDGAATSVNATVSDPTNGRVTYVWAGTEFSTPGTWWAEIWVGNTTNRLASSRMEARVRAPVGVAPVI